MARQLIRQGSLWNSGIFVWKASTLLELMHRYQPKIAEGLEAIKQQLPRENRWPIPVPSCRNVIAREYKKMPNISIDYAVLEKAGSEGKVITLEADFGWSDVGSWAAVHRMMPNDDNGNAGNGTMAQPGRQKLSHSRSGPVGGALGRREHRRRRHA